MVVVDIVGTGGGVMMIVAGVVGERKAVAALGGGIGVGEVGEKKIAVVLGVEVVIV